MDVSLPCAGEKAAFVFVPFACARTYICIYTQDEKKKGETREKGVQRGQTVFYVCHDKRTAKRPEGQRQEIETDKENTLCITLTLIIFFY